MISALIVDDEKQNRESLLTLLTEYCPDVNVIGEASSVEAAIQFLSKQNRILFFWMLKCLRVVVLIFYVKVTVLISK